MRAALFALALAVLALLPAEAYAQAKIAVIDFQAALEKVNEGKLVQARLEGIYNEKRAQLGKMEQQLVTMQEEFQKQAAVLSDEAKRQKQQEFMTKQGQFEQMVMASEQEFQMAYQKEMEGLITKMKVTAGEVAKAKGYDLVLDSAAVAYTAVPDLTADLVLAYNKKHGGG
jgi:outer membrane protein